MSMVQTGTAGVFFLVIMPLLMSANMGRSRGPHTTWTLAYTLTRMLMRSCKDSRAGESAGKVTEHCAREREREKRKIFEEDVCPVAMEHACR